MDLFQIAGDTRANLDGIHRDEAADIFVQIDDAALDRLRHRHGGWRRSSLLLLALTARKQRGRKQKKCGGKPREGGRDHGVRVQGLLMLQCGRI